MRLVSRGKKPSRTFSGPGYLYQSGPGTLAYRVYSSRRGANRQTGLLNLARTGEVLPEEAYFDLEAIDVRGRRFVSKRFLLDSIEHAADGMIVIDGPIGRLLAKSILQPSLRPKGHSIEIESFQRLELPWNDLTVRQTRTKRSRRSSKGFSRDTWTFSSQGFKISVREGDDRTSLEAFSPSKRLFAGADRRLVEALEFILGHEVRAQITRVRRSRTIETTVSAARTDTSSARWHPPLVHLWISIPGTNKVTDKYHQRLFDRFLHTFRNVEGRANVVSGQLDAIREASRARYIDAQALTLTVAVESLLLNVTKVRVRRPAARKVAALTKWIRSWQGDSELRARVLGSVGNMRSVRAGDVLKALVKKGVVTQTQSESWQALRNQSAHQYQSAGAKSERLRELLPHVQVLFYRLVFYVIGYRGPYTDYASLDWPTRTFP
jgi:hypothetical protein